MVAAWAKERLLAELTAFDQDVRAWQWDETDPRANCGTHGRALRAVMGRAAESVRVRANAIAQPDPGDRVRALRDLERELGVVRAISAGLREKIDARLAAATGPLLRAADELVWSMHRSAMQRARAGNEPPVPLVSVGPEWGAEMVPVPRLDLRTRGSASASASAILEQLGIREIRLPWAAVQEPWLLSLVVHEVGHAVQFDLLPGAKLVEDFPGWLAAAIGGPRADLWQRWATEVFADACAVAATGRALLPVLVAWETTATAKLRSGDPLPERYPPPVVRWWLVHAWSVHLDLADLGPPLGGEPPAPAPLDARLEALIGDLPAVVAALDQPLPGVGRKIRQLWPETKTLLGDPLKVKRRTLADGMLVADGTMAGARAALVAAVEKAAVGPPAPAEYGPWRQDLGGRVLALLGACRGPGTRSAGKTVPPESAGDLLASLAREAREEADDA